MEKQARIREIKLNIENEFILNLITYFVREENYVFVGNEHEVWLENLSHPKVQLIYINDQKKMTAGHATYISQKIKIISKQIKRKFLMTRVHALILNTCDFDEMIETDGKSYALIIHVKDAKDANKNEKLGYFFPAIADFNLNASMIEIAARLQNETRRQVNSEIDISRNKKRPFVNNTYLALLVLFFLYLWFSSQNLSTTFLPPSDFLIIHYGSTYSPLIVAGEYWRLISAAFMHIAPMHLIFNAVFIYRFGAMVEGIFGKWRMVLIIFISAITASLFGFAFSPIPSIGASGVAYGFIGVLVFLGFEMRRTFMPLLKGVVVPMLLMSVVISLFIPNIDHFGHLGGFVGGFFAAAIVGVPKMRPFIARVFLSVVTLAILTRVLWVSGVRLTENTNFDNLNRHLIRQYYELGDIDRVNQLGEIFFEEVE